MTIPVPGGAGAPGLAPTPTPGVFAGTHVLAQLAGVEPAVLDDVHLLRRCLEEALTEAGATVCDAMTHRFTPQGVSVVVVLAESHASLHSYPELGTAFVDVFTCGAAADPAWAVQRVALGLGAGVEDLRVLSRGDLGAGTARAGGGT